MPARAERSEAGRENQGVAIPKDRDLIVQFHLVNKYPMEGDYARFDSIRNSQQVEPLGCAGSERGAVSKATGVIGKESGKKSTVKLSDV